MIHASLFTGIGGFDLAAEWMGWENAFHCEWNSFCQTILKHYWPNATSYEDITKTDFTIWRRRIDVLTGGFPCQPYSVAGKQLGTEDERHLWPEMLRAIREIKPRWVVGENVRGLVNWSGGLVFEQVQADLEAEGYEVLPFLLPAAGVGAPHRRYRIWFIAYSSRDGYGSVDRYSKIRSKEGKSENFKKEWKWIWQDTRRTGSKKITTHTCITKLERIREAGDFGRQREDRQEWQRIKPSADIQPVWRNFPTQSPVCTGNDGFYTESLRQYFREDSHGVISEKEIDKILSKASTEWRNESIKGGGNAIVPQVALQIFKAIQKYSNIRL